MKIYQIAAVLCLTFLFQLNAMAAWDGKSETFDWYVNADSLTGESVNDPFVISSESDLAALSRLVSGSVAKTSPHPNAFDGKYFILANDLDFGKKGNWKPIGDKKHPFRGYFLGQGHTIKNLNIDYKCNEKTDLSIDVYSEASKARTEDISNKFQYSACNDLGLFGNIMHSEIKDLVLKDININGNYIIGGICGHASWDSKIQNCSVEGELKGNGFIGGICGFMEMNCTIDSCSTYGSIITSGGKLANGGICGIAQTKCIIQNCQNTCDIFCNDAEYVGGVCGLINLFGTISHCANSGNISVKSSVNGIFASFGGICGVVGHSCKLVETTNIGNLSISTNQGFAGGTCGLASEETSLLFNFNAGSIKGSKGSICGGICGMNYRNTTSNNINVGNVDGDGIKGGIIGYNFRDRSLVTKCYYDKQMCPLKYGIGITEANSKKGSNHGTEEMTTSDLTTIISKSLDTEKWSFVEGNYPTLKEMERSEIVKISAQPLILQDGQTINNVSSSFNANTTNGIRWAFKSGDAIVEENGNAKLLQKGFINMTLTNGISKKTVTLKSDQ